MKIKDLEMMFDHKQEYEGTELQTPCIQKNLNQMLLLFIE